MKKEYLLTFFFLFIFMVKGHSQDWGGQYERKRFFNLGLIGIWSTNGEYTNETTNNISISLIHGSSKNVYGFCLAPFSYIESSIHGLQVGLSNGAAKVRGMQIGFANGTGDLKGMQIGGFNFIEDGSGGIQLGFGNYRKSGGLQIGIVNIADHNDYPIGIINIIKEGHMNLGMSIDEMSNLMVTFRSGGKYMYGVAGVGYSFASSLNQFIFEGGIGAHVYISDRLRIDTEIVAASIGKLYMYTGDSEEAERKAKDYDYKHAFRASIRFLPTYRFGKHIEVFGGPSLNYLQSQCLENEKIFPSNYMWRNFSSTSLTQMHWGWTAGVQYKF